MNAARKITRPYFHLVAVSQYDGSWAIEFGDYDRDTVEQEADDVADGRDLKASQWRIVAGDQADAVAVCAKLNDKAHAKSVADGSTWSTDRMAWIKPRKATAAKSSIIYRGPSEIDGAPIVVVAVVKSSNGKTGNMLQTFILRDDMDPREANKTGADFSICGGCTLRGDATQSTDAHKLAPKRSCYVVIGQAPTGVYKAVQRGGVYAVADTPAKRADVGRGRMVRIGTYGDGAAVPAYVWHELKSEADGITAYSHQANQAGAAFDASIYMQSVESAAAASVAWSLGRRTFRIVSSADDIVKESEIECPSARGVQCVDCGLCDGSKRAKSIAIVVHGGGAVHFAVQ